MASGLTVGRGTVVLTGATGFLGGAVAKELVSLGHQVVAVVRSAPPNASGGIHYVSLLDDSALVDELVAYQPAAVVHIAAFGGSEAEPSEFESVVRANITLGALMLEVAARAQQSGSLVPFVGIGSFWQRSVSEDGVVHPNSLYAASKEALVAISRFYSSERDVAAIFLQPTDIYGSGDGRGRFLGLLAGSIESGDVIEVTGGEQVVSFVHVRDVVAAVVQAIYGDHEMGSVRSYSVTGPEVGSLRSLVEQLAAETGVTMPVVWGERPYRWNEVMTPDLLPALPGWEPQIPLRVGFDEIRGS